MIDEADRSREIPTDLRKRALDVLVSSAMSVASGITLDAKDVAEYYSGLLAESDRATGILAFAFIESQINHLFSQHLDPQIQGGAASIIGQNGILDTVGSRLKMLRALRWLGQETYADLRLLANIRNRFAHSHVALTFDDSKIRGYLSSLSKHEDKFANEHGSLVVTTKQTFLIRAVMTLFGLYTELVIMPASLRAGLGSHGAFSAGYDRFPPQLQEALTRCIHTVDLIYGNVSATT